MAGIILHHYPRSPFAEKVRLALGLKSLDYHAVTIPALMPKPELMPLTGGYRRTPVLQVGADIYCDTLAILHQLERLHPALSLYPAGTRGAANALGWSIERAIFVPAVGVVRALSDAPPNPAMSEDRRGFFGFDIDKPAMLAQLPIFLQRLTVQLHWLGQMLADGRNFLLGAEPGAADLSAFHPIWFIRQNGGPGVDALLPGLAPLQGWFERIAAIGHGNAQEMTAAEALSIAAAAEPAALDGTKTGVAGCRLGDEVSVTPDDSGRDPVRGILLAASDDTIVLGRTDPIVGRVNLHFPRAGFDVTP
jgi:glutathione S-transferase